MDDIYYNLMKNYGTNETKMEVVLFTLLKNNNKFKKAFLKKSFNSIFDYENAKIEMEVSRRKTRQGRTDIEVTDPDGNKYIAELKIGPAYPTREQLDMYWSIKNVKEVATLTNIEDKNHLFKEKNITWQEVADILKKISGLEIFYNFINDFGPLNGKGNSKIPNYNNENSFMFFISNKAGNYLGNNTGITILEKYSKYIFPSASNAKFGKNYIKLHSNYKYLAFRYSKEDCDKGETYLKIMRIKSVKNMSAKQIDRELGKKVMKYSGDHNLVELEEIKTRKMIYGYKNGMVKFKTDIKLLLDENSKTVKEIGEKTKLLKIDSEI